MTTRGGFASQKFKFLNNEYEVEKFITNISELKNLYKVGKAVALILGSLFFISAVEFSISIIWPDLSNRWYLFLQTNWLIVIFKLHNGLIHVIDNPLYGLNIFDMIIMVLFSILSFAISNILKKVNRIWPPIAFALSVISIMLFIITQMVGRSTIMLSVLIFSFVMLRKKALNKTTIYAGILGGIFLFTGDLTVGIDSNMITILFGIGYVLLTLWFFLIGRKLFLFDR